MRADGEERVVIGRCHDALTLLCDELEALADSLPRDRLRGLTVGSRVHRLIVSSHTIEEAHLFGPLATLTRQIPDMQPTLARLRSEHHADSCCSEEINDALLAFGRVQESITADALGYMLRAFFVSVRRHVAFEREILSPLLTLVRYPLIRSVS